MDDDSDQIVSLLTQIRDNQREAIELQKTAVSRQKSMSRTYYSVVVLAIPLFAYFTYLLFHSQ